jgi:hypothetical protein
MTQSIICWFPSPWDNLVLYVPFTSFLRYLCWAASVCLLNLANFKQLIEKQDKFHCPFHENNKYH